MTRRWGRAAGAVLMLGATACADPLPPATQAARASLNTGSVPASAPGPVALRPPALPLSAAASTGSAPGTGTIELKEPDSKPLEAHRAAFRARSFKRQVPVALPADLPAALRALTPQNPEFAGTAEAPAAKVVAWERHEGMIKVRPVPGGRMDSMRFATLDRGPTLVAGVVERLRAGGWLGPDEEPHSPLAHPQHGVLHLTLTEYDETPTILEFRLISKTTEAPADARVRLEATPAWLSATAALSLVGYEYGRHHQYTPRASFTDLERLAFAVQAPDRAALWARLQAAALKAGYRTVPDNPRLMDRGTTTLAVTLPDAALPLPDAAPGSGPGAAPGSGPAPIEPVPAGPGPLVIHHQRPFSLEPALTPRP